jgi:hypothetical protein
MTLTDLRPPENEVRRKLEDQLLNKLYDIGVLSSSSKVRLLSGRRSTAG